MFCRMCGKALPSDARFCIYCGEAVTLPVETAPEEKENAQYHFQPDPEFVWNVEGFPERASKKTEDVEFTWSKLRNTERLKPATDTESAQSGKEQPKEETATEEKSAAPQSDVQFDWNRGNPPKRTPAYTSTYERNTERLSREAIEEADRARKEAEAARLEKERAELAAAKTAEPEKTAPEKDIKVERTISDPEAIFESIKADTKEAERTVSEQEKKIDKFYTFNQKNEEFQKLLDREYEKIRKGKSGEAAAEREESSPKTNEESVSAPAAQSRSEAFASQETKPKAAEEREQAAPESSEPAHTEEQPQAQHADSANPKAMPFIKGEELLRDNEELKPFDTRELNKDLLEIALTKSGLDPNKYVLDDGASDEPKKAEKQDDANERPLGRETRRDFRPMFLVEQEDGQPEKAKESEYTQDSGARTEERPEHEAASTASPVNTASEPAPAASPAEAAAETAAQELPWIHKNIDWEKKRELDALWGTIEIEGFPDPQKSQKKQEDEPKAQAPDAAEPQQGASKAAQVANVKAAEGRAGASQETQSKPENDAVSAEKAANPYLIPEYEDDDEEEGAGGIIKFFIGLLVVLLLIEVAILGIRYFAPDTQAGIFVEEKLGIATDWVQHFLPDSTDSDADTDTGASTQGGSDVSGTGGQSQDSGSTADSSETTDSTDSDVTQQ